MTLWDADSFEAAIELAEAEAREYADALGATYPGLAQAFQFDGPPGAGADVFSLIRASELAADEYISRFFDTGTESQRDL